MTTTRLLIVVSVGFNVVLTILLFREPIPNAVVVPPLASSSANSPSSSAPSPDLRDVIASGDLNALLAAGVPEATARRLSLGHAYTIYRAKLRAVHPAADDDPRYRRGSARARQPLTG